MLKGTITVPNAARAAAPDNRNKKVIFKNCTPFIYCISEVSNTQIDYTHDIDVVMPMYNLIEDSYMNLKTLGSLLQCYRDEPVLNNNDIVIEFLANNNNSISYKIKEKITGETESNDTKDVEVPLINCGISFILTWSKNCF